LDAFDRYTRDNLLSEALTGVHLENSLERFEIDRTICELQKCFDRRFLTQGAASQVDPILRPHADHHKDLMEDEEGYF